MSRSLFQLDPRFRPYAVALLTVARQYRLEPVVTSTRRTIAEQKRLYEAWRRGQHAYPVAPPGQSAHNYGLAIDLVSRNNNWLGRVWCHWGGLWSMRDRVHFGLR